MLCGYDRLILLTEWWRRRGEGMPPSLTRSQHYGEKVLSSFVVEGSVKAQMSSVDKAGKAIHLTWASRTGCVKL